MRNSIGGPAESARTRTQSGVEIACDENLEPDRTTACLPILYVDDEPDNLRLFRLTFSEQFEVHTANSGAEALALLARHDFGVLLSDERMPGMSGVELLARASALYPDALRIVVSAYADSGRLLAAMNRCHAYEYVVKPWCQQELRDCIVRADAIAKRRRRLLARAALAERLIALPAHADPPLIGVGSGMRALEQLVRRIARSDATALILGETGTGKELVARAIHALSPRAQEPFVALNCAAVPEGLIESELFGHEQGAFTGASKARKGRFELASGGTLFLDEIGDISARVQVSLLRALQERRIERVGSNTTLAVDVRVIAATHRALDDAVRRGSFRQDLYYRLNVLHVQVPPLRARIDDLPDLVQHFLCKWSHSALSPVRGLSADALAALRQYDWPGNVRELENMVQRALVIAEGPELTLDDFTFHTLACAERAGEAMGPVRAQSQAQEERTLRQLLLAHGGNVSRAARALGVPRTTLMSRARRVGLL